jgi:hypothetical protein
MKSISDFRYNRDIEDGYEAETTIESQRSPRFNPPSDAEIRDGGFVWVGYSLSCGADLEMTIQCYVT